MLRLFLGVQSSIAIVDLIGAFAVVFNKGVSEEYYNHYSLKQVVNRTYEKD